MQEIKNYNFVPTYSGLPLESEEQSDLIIIEKKTKHLPVWLVDYLFIALLSKYLL